MWEISPTRRHFLRRARVRTWLVDWLFRGSVPASTSSLRSFRCHRRRNSCYSHAKINAPERAVCVTKMVENFIFFHSSWGPQDRAMLRGKPQHANHIGDSPNTKIMLRYLPNVDRGLRDPPRDGPREGPGRAPGGMIFSHGFSIFFSKKRVDYCVIIGDKKSTSASTRKP